MEKPSEFVSEVVENEVNPISASAYIGAEIVEDISLFSTNERIIIEKWARGEKLSPKEQSSLALARNNWFLNKYGVPYEIKIARNEIISRKYAPPEKLARATMLQKKMLGAIAKADTETLDQLKTEYGTEYPDQLEGVEAIFSLPQYFKEQETVNGVKKSGYSEEIRPLFQSLTEYRFLLADFVLHNGGDKLFLGRFWKVMEEIAKKNNKLGEFHKLQRSTTSQVAVNKIFDKLGFKPRLSHPSEDAFKAIDMWSDSDTAIQVKGQPGNKVILMETDDVAFPGAEFKKEEQDGGEKTYHVNSYMSKMAQQFRSKLSKYGKLTNKQLKGLFIVIPYGKIDFITGEPSAELVQSVKERLSTELK